MLTSRNTPSRNEKYIVALQKDAIGEAVSVWLPVDKHVPLLVATCDATSTVNICPGPRRHEDNRVTRSNRPSHRSSEPIQLGRWVRESWRIRLDSRLQCATANSTNIPWGLERFQGRWTWERRGKRVRGSCSSLVSWRHLGSSEVRPNFRVPTNGARIMPRQILGMVKSDRPNGAPWKSIVIGTRDPGAGAPCLSPWAFFRRDFARDCVRTPEPSCVVRAVTFASFFRSVPTP